MLFRHVSSWIRIIAAALLAGPWAASARAQCPDGTPPPCRGATPRASAPPAGSIAVLPFVNRSPDSTDAYLAEALPEQIVGRLARVTDLRVKSATAVTAQWRRTPDPMAAARALRVEWFVTGSIRRVGRQLAISAELVRAASGDGTWSAPFRRGDGDLAAVEEQIAESVAVAIVGRLAPSQLSALRITRSRDPEAYRLYLYGRARAARRTTADIAASREALTEAVRLDPAFASGWALLSHVRSLQTQWATPELLTADSLLALARAAAERALALDSTISDVWMALAHISLLRGDLGRSHETFSRALRIDSGSVNTLNGAGYMYSVEHLALPEIGAPIYQRLLDIDPDYRNAWRHLALLRMQQGRLAEAEALLDSALARGPWGPGFHERSAIRFMRGNGAGALADLEEGRHQGQFQQAALAELPDSARGALYMVLLGDSVPARATLARFEAPNGSTWQRLFWTAVFRTTLGMRASALDALEQLRALRTPDEDRCGREACSVSLRTWQAVGRPVFAALRTDPRFQRLVTETRPRVPWLARQ